MRRAGTGRPSYARYRPGGEEAYRKDTGKRLEDYDSEETPKAFISYQYQVDVQKVNLMRYQATESNKLKFEETSSTERYPDNWKPYASRDIKRSDEVIVVVGKDTYKSDAVNWEIKKAHENDIPVVAVKTNEDVQVPKEITKNDDKVVNWKLEKIQKELHTTVTSG
jgi:hypothetical protein